MRKILPISLFVLLFSFFPILQTKAFDEAVDQKNTTISQAAVVIYNYGHNQTFTPDKDMLTKVQVYMKERRSGAGITLTVKKVSSGATVATSWQRMGEGNGWEIFDLTNSNPDGYEIEIGQLYSIWLETGYYSTDPVPTWTRTDNNVYSGGTRMQNSTVYEDDDFVFATYGYNLPEPEIDEGTDDQGQTPVDQDEDTQDSQQGTEQDQDTEGTDQDEETIDNETPEEETVEDEANLISTLDSDSSEDKNSKEDKDDNALIWIIISLAICCLLLTILLTLIAVLYKSKKFRETKLGKKLDPIFLGIDKLINKLRTKTNNVRNAD